jgi:hypothetical protein
MYTVSFMTYYILALPLQSVDSEAAWEAAQKQVCVCVCVCVWIQRPWEAAQKQVCVCACACLCA